MGTTPPHMRVGPTLIYIYMRLIAALHPHNMGTTPPHMGEPVSSKSSISHIYIYIYIYIYIFLKSNLTRFSFQWFRSMWLLLLFRATWASGADPEVFFFFFFFFFFFWSKAGKRISLSVPAGCSLEDIFHQ